MALYYQEMDIEPYKILPSRKDKSSHNSNIKKLYKKSPIDP